MPLWAIGWTLALGSEMGYTSTPLHLYTAIALPPCHPATPGDFHSPHGRRLLSGPGPFYLSSTVRPYRPGNHLNILGHTLAGVCWRRPL